MTRTTGYNLGTATLILALVVAGCGKGSVSTADRKKSPGPMLDQLGGSDPRAIEFAAAELLKWPAEELKPLIPQIEEILRKPWLKKAAGRYKKARKGVEKVLERAKGGG